VGEDAPRARARKRVGEIRCGESRVILAAQLERPDFCF